MGERFACIIVGGGLVGCALAARLARLGVAPLALFERDWVGAGASGRSCGRVGQATTSAELVVRSLGLLAEAGEAFGVEEIGFVGSGHLTLATTPEAAAALEAERRVLAEAGLEARLVDAAAAAALDPWLACTDVLAALHLPAGGYLEVFTAARRLAEAARAGGVSVLENRAALGLVRAGGRILGIETALAEVPAEAVVLALGPFTPFFPERLDLGLRLERQIAVTFRPEAIYEPTFPVVVERGAEPAVAFRPTHDGVVRVAPLAAGAVLDDPEAIEDVVGGDEIAALAERFAVRFPGASDAVFTRASVGPVALSDDGGPLIGALEEGLYVAAGFGAEGVGLGLAAADLIARALAHGEALPAAFSPARARSP